MPSIDKFGIAPGASSAELQLRKTRRRHELGGPIWREQDTDREWWVLDFYSAPQRAHVALAAALYNAVGALAPDVQQMRLGGDDVLAFRAPREWIPLPPSKANELHGEQLEALQAADVWVRNTATTRGRRFRRTPLPGLPSVLTLDLSQCLGYSGRGKRDPKWGAEAVQDVPRSKIRTAIERVGQQRLRDLVYAIGFPPDVQAELWGTLMARREAIRRSAG